MLKVRRTLERALSVTCGDSSPKGGAKAYPHTRIGAFLPLPSGEVAARSADGEGEAVHAQSI